MVRHDLQRDHIPLSLNYLPDESSPSILRDPDHAAHERIFGMHAKLDFPYIPVFPYAPSEGNTQARGRRLGRRLERFIPGMNPGTIARRSL